jgi:nicotinate-nucleotide adenylyltransferase
VRFGLLGGTFDPFHLAHLRLAGAASAALNLDQVIFIPTGQPWLKEGLPLSPACHRVAMVRLAIADQAGYSVSEIEVNRPGPTYTVDTLEQLSIELGPEAQLYLILGMDALEHFRRWKEPGRILELSRLAVAARPALGAFTLETFLTQFPAAAGDVTLLPVVLPDISATEVRSRAVRQGPLEEVVPAGVADYIRRSGIYAAETEVDAK